MTRTPRAAAGSAGGRRRSRVSGSAVGDDGWMGRVARGLGAKRTVIAGGAGEYR
jgi:hypothetical protein